MQLVPSTKRKQIPKYLTFLREIPQKPNLRGFHREEISWTEKEGFGVAAKNTENQDVLWVLLPNHKVIENWKMFFEF